MTLFIDLLNNEIITHKIAQVELDKMDKEYYYLIQDQQDRMDFGYKTYEINGLSAEFEMTVNGWKFIGLDIDKIGA